MSHHNLTTVCEVDDDARDIEDIQSIVTIVVCSVGLVFNILNIIITARTPVKGSLSIYLISLSVIDALFLLTVLPTRAFRCGEECVDRPLAAQFYEKFIYIPMGNIFAVTDIFITVIWGLHRLSYLHRPRIITDNSMIPKIATAASLLVATALNIPSLLQYTVADGRVVESSLFNTHNKHDLHYQIILVVCTRGIPVAVLILTNILLIRAVNRAMKRRKRLVFQRSKQVKDIYRQMRINILLILVICLMLIGNIPVLASIPEFSVHLFQVSEQCLGPLRSFRILRSVGNILEQVAFSFNFVIYYAMNKNFQKFMSNVAPCLRLRDKSKISPQDESC